MYRLGKYNHKKFFKKNRKIGKNRKIENLAKLNIVPK